MDEQIRTREIILSLIVLMVLLNILKIKEIKIKPKWKGT